MDPATALGAASAVLGLVSAAETAVTTFVDFVKGVRIVDATVAGFLREVQTLLSLIRAIIQKMDELPLALKEDRVLRGLWGPMEETLKECRKTVAELTRLFRRLNDSAGGGFIQSAITQIRLQMQSKEIADLRDRIASLQRNFQTAMGAMNVFLAIDRRVELKKIENYLSDFQEKYDSQKHILNRLRESETNGSNPQPDMREIQEENMLRAARPMVKSANSTFERLSTVGSEFSDQQEEMETQDHISDWRERVNVAEVPTAMPDLDPMDSIFWPQDTTMSWPLEIISPENIRIRSNLIQQGITAYARSDYALANNCFRDAYDVGPVSTTSLPDEGVGDDTLKAWLWLSEIRFNSRLPKWPNSRVSSGLMEPHVNPAAIKVESRMQICQDACILSLAFMYRGDMAKAHDLCEAAQAGILKLKETTRCKEYAEAVLAMVEIQYARKGNGPIAESWSDLLLKDHREILQGKATEFFLQKFDDPSEGAHPFRLDIYNNLPNSKLPKAQPVTISDAKNRLYNAVERGNFPAALFVIRTFEASLLKLTDAENRRASFSSLLMGARKTYLDCAIDSDSPAIVSLLLQHRTKLEGSSSRVQSSSTSLDSALSTAIVRNFAGAVGLLIDAGANKNTYTYESRQRSREKPCYNLDSVNTKTSILAEAVLMGHQSSVNALFAKGATVNLPPTTYSGSTTYYIEPALHVAIRCFDGRQMIPLLLEHRANVDYSFRDVRPLGLAIYHSGKPADNMSSSSADERIVSRRLVVEQLINAGADVNRRSVINGVRVTPLQQARNEGLTSIVRLLLEHGAVERKTTSRRKVRRKTTRTRIDTESEGSEHSLADD